MTTERPRFLDEAAPETPTKSPPNPDPEGPKSTPSNRPQLLAAEPDAPDFIETAWPEEISPRDPAGSKNVHWLGIGLALLLFGLALVAVEDALLSIAAHSMGLAIATGLLLFAGLGFVITASVKEWLSFRRLKAVDSLRNALADHTGQLNDTREQALAWITSIAADIPEREAVETRIKTATTLNELNDVLGNRVIEPLYTAARAKGRYAAIQLAALIVISPHPSWHGIITTLRALILIRAVASLFGLKPGVAVTLSMLRNVAWTAVGTAATDLVAMSVADQLIGGVPIVKHVAASIPGADLAAVRLYRLASLTAEACCPVRMGH